MKQLILLSLACFPLLLFSQKDSSDKREIFQHPKITGTNKAWVIIEQQLNIIKKKLDNPYTDSSVIYQSAMRFLESLSGVYSESDIDWAGKNPPSLAEYKMWDNWFFANKNNIYWDENNKKVVLHIAISPPQDYKFPFGGE